MQEVEAICNRVLIINKGKIVADNLSGTIDSGIDAGFQTVLVEFDNEIAQEKIQSLDRVDKVLNLKDKNWLIQTDQDYDIRGDIFEFAVREGLKVLSLQKQEKSLEEVFRLLTN